MKNQKTTILLGLALISTSLFAQADRFSEYAKVNYSKPIYETVEEIIPHKHTSSCYQEYKVRTPRNTNSSYKDQNTIGVDTIIGATTGVIIGHQIGRGNGKVAAKVIGGILGATLANNMRNYQRVQDNRNNDGYYYETKRKNICNNGYKKVIRKNVLKGYDNYFTYNGKEYSKFTPYQEDYVKVETKINF